MIIEHNTEDLSRSRYIYGESKRNISQHTITYCTA